jgi:hypothetical protein
MANSERIDEIIAKSGFDQVTKLQTELAKTNEALVQCILSAEKFNSVIINTSSLKEFNKEALAAQLAVEKLNKAKAATAVAQEKERQAIIKTQEAEELAASRRRARDEKQAKIDNAKIVADAKKGKTIISNSQLEIDAYNNSVNGNKRITSALTETAKAENEVASKAAAIVSTNKKVTESFLKVSPAAVNAQRSIQSLKIQLDSYKNISQTATDPKILEQFNAKIQETESKIKQLSNVGKDGFDEFGNAIEKTGGGVGDAYGKLKELANILPGIGVAGIIAFAAGPIIDYIETLGLFDIKTTEAIKRKKELNDVNLAGAKNAQQELVELKTLYDTTKNVALSSEQRYNAAKALQDQYPETFKNYSIEQIELGKVDAGYKQLTQSIIATAKARASQDKIAENSARQLDDEQKVIDATINYTEAVNGLAAARQRYSVIRKSIGAGTSELSGAEAQAQSKIAYFTDQQAEAAKIIREAKKDSMILDERNKALAENIFKQQQKGADLAGKVKAERAAKTNDPGTDSIVEEQKRVQAVIDASKRIVDNDSETLDIRLSALQIFGDSSERLIRLQGDKELQNDKLTTAGRMAVEQNVQNKIIESREEGAKRSKELADFAQKSLIDSLTKDEQDQVNAIAESNANKLALIEQYKSEAEQGVIEQYANGVINTEQYNRQIYDIEAQASQDRLQLQIDALKQIIEIEKSYLQFGVGTAKKIAEDEAALAKIQTDLSGKVAKVKLEDAQKVAAARNNINEKEKQLARELLAFTTSLFEGSFTRQQNAIQAQIDLNEKKKAQDIEGVNESVASEEEKANKIAIINARAAAQEALLEQKKRDIQIKQAKFDKAAAISGVILNIALANTKTLATTGFLGLPLLPIIAAIGAVQIAAILAQPIPKFQDGGKMRESGLALYGEVGTELMIDPSGNLSLTPDKPTVGYVQAGTEFISNKDLIQMIAKPVLHNTTKNDFDFAPLMRFTQKENEKLIKALKPQKQSVVRPSKRGFLADSERISALQEYFKRNI